MLSLCNQLQTEPLPICYKECLLSVIKDWWGLISLPLYYLRKIMKWCLVGLILSISSPLFSQSETESSSSIQPALEKDKYFFIDGGYANWEPSAVKAHLRLSEASNFNGIFPNSNLGKKDRLNSFDFSSTARTIGLGIVVPSKNGFHRGKFSISYTGTGSGYLENLFYRSTNFNYLTNFLNTQESGISQYSLGSVKRYTAQYDHDFYFLPDHASKYLVGIGIKFGINLEMDTFSPKSRTLSFVQSTVSIGSNQDTRIGNSLPLQSSEMYDQISGTGILGFTYRLATFPNQELELNSSYYSGNGRIYQTATYNQYVSVGTELFPIRISDDIKGRTEVEGRSFSFSYLFKISEMRNIKIFIMDKSMNHRFVRLETISSPRSLPVFEGLGPYPDISDRIRTVGLEFQIKF